MSPLPQKQVVSEYREDNLIVKPGEEVTRNVLLHPGVSYKRGDILGEIVRLDGDLSGDVVANENNTGDGSVTATPGASVKKGVYTVNLTSATDFDVIDPDGGNLGSGTVVTTFVNAQISIDVTAGATPFENGDSFTITVNQVESLYKKYDPASSEGNENASVVQGEDLDLTTEVDERSSYAYERGVFNSNYMYVTTGDILDIKEALRDKGIHVKESVKRFEV